MKTIRTFEAQTHRSALLDGVAKGYIPKLPFSRLNFLFADRSHHYENRTSKAN